MNPQQNINVEPSLVTEPGHIQTQYTSFQNFEQYTASGYTNAPLYISKPTGIGTISRIAPHCSTIGSQNKIETTTQEVSIPGMESHAMVPTVRYIQAHQLDEGADFGLSGLPPCGLEPHYSDEPVVSYGYTSDANYGLPGVSANIKQFATRPFDNNLNGSEPAIDSQCRSFENQGDYKLPPFATSSLNTAPPRICEKEDFIVGSNSDLCSTMRWRDPNLSEVISFLSNPNNAIKANAAAYLQHLCYMDDPNKQRTRTLGGIPPLVRLLSYDAPEIHK